MLAQNVDYATKYNLIQWHDKGYTGRNVRIAVFDESPYIWDNMKSYCSSPFPITSIKATHATDVAAQIHEFAPDAQLFMTGFLSTPVIDIVAHAKWIADPANKIDLISCSCISTANNDAEYFKILKDSGIPMFCAAGNGSHEYQNNDTHVPASFDWTYAIGGVIPLNDTKVSYSDYGNILECMMYTSPYMLNADNTVVTFSGTSFCQPQACAVMACVAQMLKEKDIKVTRELLLDFMGKNVHDIYTPGRDNLSGFGILKLPDVTTYYNSLEVQDDMKVELTIGSNIATIDGAQKQLTLAPKIIDGSTMVTLRDLSTILGCSVEYISATKKIIITK